MAGIVGIIVFGLVIGALTETTSIVGFNYSSVTNWIILLVYGAIVGLAFTWWFGNLAVTTSSGSGYGLVHGLIWWIWWILGGLFILPLITGMPMFSDAFSSNGLINLLAHLIMGVALGLIYTGTVSRVTERRFVFAARDDDQNGPLS